MQESVVGPPLVADELIHQGKHGEGKHGRNVADIDELADMIDGISEIELFDFAQEQFWRTEVSPVLTGPTGRDQNSCFGIKGGQDGRDGKTPDLA
jgi:hypothetical protein